MTVTKEKLINLIASRLGSKKQARAVIETLFETIKERLSNGENVLISGFGKFCVKEKGERRGRNPYTGDDLMLDARRVIVFKFSKVLKDKIKGNPPEDRKG